MNNVRPLVTIYVSRFILGIVSALISATVTMMNDVIDYTVFLNGKTIKNHEHRHRHILLHMASILDTHIHPTKRAPSSSNLTDYACFFVRRKFAIVA